MLRLSVLIVIAATTSQAVAQSWSYESDSSCFHYRTAFYCFQRDSLERLAGSREQLDAELAGAQPDAETFDLLSRAWLDNHAQIHVERKEIPRQINAYYEAAFTLNDEAMEEQRTLISTYLSLASIDISRQAFFHKEAATETAVSTTLALLRPTMERSLPGILVVDDPKFLQQNLEIAKNYYRMTFESSEKQYVFCQLAEALAGYYQHLALGPPRLEHATLSSKPEAKPSQPDIASLKQAAAAGNVQAEAKLGLMYRDGRGVEQSDARAVNWLRRAASQGDGESQLALGLLLEEGRGVAQDILAAEMWLDLASSAGVTGAEELSGNLAAKMTSEQVSEAKRAATVWRPTR